MIHSRLDKPIFHVYKQSLAKIIEQALFFTIVKISVAELHGFNIGQKKANKCTWNVKQIKENRKSPTRIIRYAERKKQVKKSPAI